MDKQDLQDLKDCLEIYSLATSLSVEKGNWAVRLYLNDERNSDTGNYDSYCLIEKDREDIAKFPTCRDSKTSIKLLAPKVKDVDKIYSIVKMVYPHVSEYEDIQGKKHDINATELPKLEDKYLPDLFEAAVWRDMSQAYKVFMKLDFQRHSNNPSYFPEGEERKEVDGSFMKEVVKVCGADNRKLTEAARTAADMSLYNSKAKDLSYGMKLFNEVKNSQEYKRLMLSVEHKNNYSNKATR